MSRPFIRRPSLRMERGRSGTCVRSKRRRQPMPWLSPRRCARTAAWMAVACPNASKSFAVPISKFQSEVLKAPCGPTQRRQLHCRRRRDQLRRPPFLRSTSIFSTIPNTGLSAPREPTEAALAAAGYEVTPGRVREGKREAAIARCGAAMQLEWVTDAAFRFFPTQPDDLFGYVLHPVDLATNKASAAADRRVPRDIVDLVTVHENILPLGAVITRGGGQVSRRHTGGNAQRDHSAQPVHGRRISRARD